MSMTITLGQLFDGFPALESLSQLSGMPGPASWWIASTIRKLRPEYDEFSQVRQALFQKYGEQSVVGNRPMIMVLPKNEREFHAELDPLLKEEITIEITPHALIFLGKSVAAAIEPEVLHRLRFMFLEPPSVAQKLELTREEVNEALRAVGIFNSLTLKFNEDVAWWVANLQRELETVEKSTLELRKAFIWGRGLLNKEGTLWELTAEDSKTLTDTISHEVVSINVSPRPLSDLGASVDKIPPMVLVGLMFAFTEPVESPIVEA